MIDTAIDLIDTLVLLLGSGAGGWLLHKKHAIDYKKRWKDAVAALDDDKLWKTELDELIPPKDELPAHLRGLPFIPTEHQDGYRNLSGNIRVELEEKRLQAGHNPADAFGGASESFWAKGRALQLKYGWEFRQESNGWYYVGTIKDKKNKNTEKAYKRGYDQGIEIGKALSSATSPFESFSTDHWY